MKFQLNSIKKLVDDVQALGKKINVEHEENDRKFNSGSISNNSYQAKREELNNQFQTKVYEALETIGQMEDQFEEKVKAWAVLNADDLDGKAIAILNSGITIKGDDYAELESKFSGNYTMLRAVYDHAAKHNALGKFVKQASINVSEKVQAFKEVSGTGKDIIRASTLGSLKAGQEHNQSYISRLWQFEGAFEQSYARHENIINIG